MSEIIVENKKPEYSEDTTQPNTTGFLTASTIVTVILVVITLGWFFVSSIVLEEFLVNNYILRIIDLLVSVALGMITFFRIVLFLGVFVTGKTHDEVSNMVWLKYLPVAMVSMGYMYGVIVCVTSVVCKILGG